MTLLEYYRKKCQAGLIAEDPQQLIVLQHLQKIVDHLLLENNKRNRLFTRFRKPKAVQGLYVWGSVGVGKTFLLDGFYHCLPIKNKIRIHFHRFMQQVHQALKKHQGAKDPLQIVAKDIASRAMVLCFDELFVSEIVDAMLLARLFKALLHYGVTLVITSNTRPDDLYKDGLQRQQFLPTIALLKQHTTIFHITTHEDYRLRYLKNAGVFYTPDDASADEQMKKTFQALTQGQLISTKSLELAGREIKIIKQSEEVIWFDFATICAIPRNSHEYLAIAKMFPTIFISHIPEIKPQAHDTIILFIRLIDILYDAKVRIIFSAAKPVEQLYVQGKMLSDYARTRSRLLEMQSQDYFLRDAENN